MPNKFLQAPLPPNHNPLIGSQHEDTLANVRDCLYTLQELTEIPQGLTLTDYATTGMHFILQCILDALKFELEYRE